MDLNCVTSVHDDLQLASSASTQMDHHKHQSTRSNRTQSTQFTRSVSYYSSLLDAKLRTARHTIDSRSFSNSNGAQFVLQPHYGDPEVLQYYDDDGQGNSTLTDSTTATTTTSSFPSNGFARPVLKSSKSLYYLPTSMFGADSDDVLNEKCCDRLPDHRRSSATTDYSSISNITDSTTATLLTSLLPQPPPSSLSSASSNTSSSCSNHPTSTTTFYYRRSMKGSPATINGSSAETCNAVDAITRKDEADKSENIKNLSQFLVKTRSRSQSPRSSFKVRASNRQKNGKGKPSSFGEHDRAEISANNDCETSTGSMCSSHSIGSTGQSFGEVSPVPKIASNHIKENLGLLSSVELKKSADSAYVASDVPEEEPSFNAFDIRSLRYSFNKVLKRRGGLWSMNAPNANEFPNCALINVRDRSQSNLPPDRSVIDVRLTTSVKSIPDGNDVSIMDLIGDNQKVFWCEVPRVQRSGLLDTFDARTRQFQEATFELITSEASYLRSLNVLVKSFYRHTSFCDSEIIDQRKKEDLFSNILEVIQVASQLLDQMELRWKQNVFVPTFCDILLRFAEQHFDVYKQYCRFKRRQERTLRLLKEKPKFNGILRMLEADSRCQGLSLHSFLLLPLQRITRYPLLLEAILSRLHVNDPVYAITRQCLHRCNQIVNTCNFAAKQYEEYESLIPKLKFNHVKCFPMLSVPRWLISIHEVSKLKSEAQGSLMGSFRSTHWSKNVIVLILLSDLVVLAKKKRFVFLDTSFIMKW